MGLISRVSSRTYRCLFFKIRTELPKIMKTEALANKTTRKIKIEVDENYVNPVNFTEELEQLRVDLENSKNEAETENQSLRLELDQVKKEKEKMQNRFDKEKENLIVENDRLKRMLREMNENLKKNIRDYTVN